MVLVKISREFKTGLIFIYYSFYSDYEAHQIHLDCNISYLQEATRHQDCKKVRHWEKPFSTPCQRVHPISNPSQDCGCLARGWQNGKAMQDGLAFPEILASKLRMNDPTAVGAIFIGFQRAPVNQQKLQSTNSKADKIVGTYSLSQRQPNQINRSRGNCSTRHQAQDH